MELSHPPGLDMSEYMEKHAVAKLIGAPPGYGESRLRGHARHVAGAAPFPAALRPRARALCRCVFQPQPLSPPPTLLLPSRGAGILTSFARPRPPPPVGYDEGGQLTEQVRTRPCARAALPVRPCLPAARTMARARGLAAGGRRSLPHPPLGSVR